MSTTMTGLINETLNILQKSPTTVGFYTQDKMTYFVNEAMDYLSCRMMESASGEWTEQTFLYDVNPGDSVIAIDPSIVLVKKVSYLIANIYQPLIYNELRQEVTYAANSGVQQYPSSYFMRQGNICFDPPVAIGGVGALKVEATSFPVELVAGDNLPTLLNRAFQHYVSYRAAFTAASSIGKAQKEWEATYSEWFDMMLRLIDKRVDQPRSVKEFDQ